MNTTNCTELKRKEFVNTLLTILYILVFVVGFVLNLCGMKCLVYNWKKLRIINIFVLNLGVADMLYLLTHPFIVYYINKNDWIFGKGLCLVSSFCFYLNLYGSIGFLTSISVYRYLSIVRPIRVMGRLTTTHSVVISVVMWILASVISCPDLSFPKYSENNSSACYDTTDPDNVEKYLTYSLCWTFIGFCIPFIVIVGCYGHVMVVICCSNMMKKNQKQQILKLLVFLIILFTFCYAPFHVFKNLSLYSRVLIKQKECRTWINGVYNARIVSFGLSAVNPLVYLCVSEDMGAQFRQLLQGCQPLFSCFKLKSSSEPVPQTEEEAESAL